MIKRLSEFWRTELGISTAAISIAEKNPSAELHTLPIILWQYGLLSLEELDRTFEWLETV